MNKIGIVVIGYKNEKSIQRLLNELNLANYNSDKPLLIISIDYTQENKVYNIAENFVWQHGKKIIKNYEKRLGLRQHILKCGNYMTEYDLDALIVFEDDTFPSRDYYTFTKAAVNKYSKNNQIAGISLYSWATNRYSQPFYPCQNNSDVYFLQYAQSWGQVWLKNAWQNFITWYEKNIDKNFNELHLPEYLDIWGDNSWLKYHIRYCIENNKYFVMPFVARSTCFSEIGEHYNKLTNINQVVLEQELHNKYNFVDLEKTNSVYDAFYENMTLYKVLNIDSADLTVDLYGTKSCVNTRYILTKRQLNFPIIKSWGNYLLPQEMNIIKNIAGNDIFLYDRKNNETQVLKVIKYANFVQLRYQILENWLWMLENNKTLQLCNNLIGIKKFAIYGYGVMGKHLCAMLKNAGFFVVCGIENKETYNIDNITIYNINEMKEEVDCIVVTVLEEYVAIEKELKQRYIVPIISIADLKIEKTV